MKAAVLLELIQIWGLPKSGTSQMRSAPGPFRASRRLRIVSKTLATDGSVPTASFCSPALPAPRWDTVLPDAELGPAPPGGVDG